MPAMRRFCKRIGRADAVVAVRISGAADEGGQLVGGDSPTFVETHFLMGIPMLRRPVKGAGGVFRFSAEILEGEIEGDEGFRGRLLRLGNFRGRGVDDAGEDKRVFRGAHGMDSA